MKEPETTAVSRDKQFHDWYPGFEKRIIILQRAGKN